MIGVREEIIRFQVIFLWQGMNFFNVLIKSAVLQGKFISLLISIDKWDQLIPILIIYFSLLKFEIAANLMNQSGMQIIIRIIFPKILRKLIRSFLHIFWSYFFISTIEFKIETSRIAIMVRHEKGKNILASRYWLDMFVSSILLSFSFFLVVHSSEWPRGIPHFTE